MTTKGIRNHECDDKLLQNVFRIMNMMVDYREGYQESLSGFHRKWHPNNCEKRLLFESQGEQDLRQHSQIIFGDLVSHQFLEGK
jgi:hypothetical protein